MKSVVYKGVEYDCQIIDTAGQVFVFFLESLPCIMVAGRVHADKLSVCYWDTRIHTRILHSIQELVQHDTGCV